MTVPIATSSYQLHRMVLLNAGTNQHVPSGRITSLDPRGGAAVLGENGVGKTTTLRIIPLFFGHLPSQIVASGQGQEPMIRFVIPTDASAIAFEYQRGSASEEDRRMAVIRRRADDHDVPFYRIYRCGFRKDLFVLDGRFLSDEDTQAKANELGIVTTSKLTTSEYRSVILRTPAVSRDKARLRAYSLDFSFGPKGLDNLDRIVAAMVKKHIAFADIVQVAVGMVQNDLGQGGERAKLTFKQGREPIQRWLNNRAACQAAFNLTTSFAEMDDDLKNHRQAEVGFRALRADSLALVGAREREQGAIEKTLQAMTERHNEELEIAANRRIGLDAKAGAAAKVAAETKRAFEEAHSTQEMFKREEALHWDGQIGKILELQSEANSSHKQIELSEAASADAARSYALNEHMERESALQARTRLDQGKDGYRASLQKAIEAIDASQRQQIEESEAIVRGQREALEEEKEPLSEQRGVWSHQKTRPAASAEAEAAKEALNVALQRAMDGLAPARQTLENAAKSESIARQSFLDQEKTIDATRSRLAQVEVALGQALAHLQPREGTVLAALRASPDEEWKRTVAKAINPALLDRSDLDPFLAEEDGATLYGWRVNTAAIATPAWADDEATQLAVSEAREHFADASASLVEEQKRLAQRSRFIREAELIVQTETAALGLRSRQVEELKAQLGAAQDRLEKERRDCTRVASDELAKLELQLRDNRKKRVALDLAHEIEIKAIHERHEQDGRDARARCNQHLAAIDQSMLVLDARLKQTLQVLKQQLNEHLSAKGVDTVRLDDMRQLLNMQLTTLAQLESKVGLVHRYRKWIEAGGATTVVSLQEAAAKAAQASRFAGSALTTFDERVAEDSKKFKAALTERDNRLSDLADALAILRSVDATFGDYQAVGVSVIDLGTPAKEMQGRVRSAQATLSKLETEIERRSGTLRQTLTAKPSSVKELVEATMEPIDSPDPITRASALANCYRLIGPQVANDVNMTLRTLLANIAAFSGAIKSFEKEVRHFNERLQRGLNAVKGFDRLSNPRLDIVTNFEDLGFYKKLTRMEEIARTHANEVGRDFARDLPPDETARALGDFMTVLGPEGNVEVNLSQFITLSGSITENGTPKPFRRASELENVSSEGLTSIVLTTLMTALLNVVRGDESIAIPWVTDEVSKYDSRNFRSLMEWLRDNRIDVVTASPELGAVQHAMFARRYLFEDRGRIREYVPKDASAAADGVMA